MSILRGLRSSYSLFGPYGVALVAKARLLRRSSEVSVSISGFNCPVRIRLRTTDVSLLSEMLDAPEYDLNFLVPPRVIVDAGSNIGLTSVYYANRYPQARILAIEPEPSNYQMLERNAAPYANITCIRAALWKNDTTITIADPGLGHWGFQTVEAADKGRSSKVEGITVDSLMTRFGIEYIDLLRVDIEGAEKEVFADSASWIERVGVVAIELHDRLKIGCSRSVYLATKDFHWELRRGETVFLGRESRGVKDALQETASIALPNGLCHQVRGKRPCSIVSTS